MAKIFLNFQEDPTFIILKNGGSWGDNTVGKMLVLLRKESEFDTQNPGKIPHVGACKPGAGEADTEDSLGLPVTLPYWATFRLMRDSVPEKVNIVPPLSPQVTRAFQGIT